MINSANIVLNTNPCGLQRYLLVNHGIQAAPEVCQDMLVPLQVALNDRPGIEWDDVADDDLIVLHGDNDMLAMIVGVAVYDIICGHGDLPRVRLGVLNSNPDVLHDHLITALNHRLGFSDGIHPLYRPTEEHLETLVSYINLQLDPEGLGDIVWVDDAMRETDLVLWAPAGVPDDIDRSMFGPGLHDYVEGAVRLFARGMAAHMRQMLREMDLDAVYASTESTT